MIKKKAVLFFLLFIGFIYPVEVFGQEQELSGSGNIRFTKKDTTEFIDPEFPEEQVNPDNQKQAGQYLRLELVPQLDFGVNDISEQDERYAVKAQLFRGETSARANYIQISDLRDGYLGWDLFVKQEYQFRSKENTAVLLKGAELSFEKPWLNSASFENAPAIQSAPLLMTPEEIYHIAQAKGKQGKGTWLLSFGASKTNQNGQQNTLFIQTDSRDKPIIDENYQKPIYLNSAISLFVPGKAEKQEIIYQTEITWILSELP